jgi:hypothetical protein
MALFDADTRADYLSALGETATVGAHSLLVDLVDDQPEIEVAGEMIVGRPYALAEPAAVTSAGIAAGSMLVVGGITWQVLSVDLDQAGFTILWLGAP